MKLKKNRMRIEPISKITFFTKKARNYDKC